MKVLAVAGASGGHIFPAVSFLKEFKKEYPDSKALLVIPRRSETLDLVPEGFKIQYISICPLKAGIKPANCRALLNFIKGSFESLNLMFDFAPDAVVGFGGIESVPLVMLAWLFRLKTVVHEQNVLPGKANRLLAKFSDKVALSFLETREFLRLRPEKIIFTGNPACQRLPAVSKQEALNFFGLKQNKFTILVIGGSHGSHSINNAFLEAVTTMNDNYKLQVIHITGSEDYDYLSRRYKDLSINVNSKVFSFLKEMQYAYSASDAVVSRAGASTISELMRFKLPCVIIPYPYAYKHQMENAKILHSLGVADIIDDDESLDINLRSALEEFLNNAEKINSLRNNFNNYDIQYNSAELLIQALSQ